ncbi:oligosaccharide flippase family protein [uncultured Polaribacter sp.]|uniref:oligosaccharide flippase family protein n=1 Tax=uncultured Polaribacter sp. TaxID=174711 RepID=UPI0037048667|tara:strand:+ start:319 stop:1548 length:1230 start_codon:yes stop_codon:yes gene_type:complete
MDNEKKIIAKNYVALLFIQGTNFILPLIIFPYLVRNLGSEKYGLVMVAQSVALFLTIIVDFGFNISATREVANLKNDKEKLSQFYWNVFSIKLVLIIITFLLLLGLIICVDKFSVDPLIYLFSFGLVLGQAIFPTWFFQGIEKMQVITIVNVAAKLFFTISLFFVVLSPADYQYVPIFNGLGFVISGLFGFVFSLQYVKFIFPKLSQVKEIIENSSSLFFSNFAVSLYTSSNTLILGFFAGDSMAGVYASMEKLILAIKSLYSPFYQAIFPNLSTKPYDEIRSYIDKMRIPIGFLGLVISIIIFFGAKKILMFAFDDAFIVGYSAVFQILGLISILSSLNMLYVTLYYPSIKKYKIRMKILISGGFLNLIIALSLVKFYTIYGVAISAVTAELFILLLAVYFYYKNKSS